MQLLYYTTAMLLYYNISHDNYTAITAITATILLYYTDSILLCSDTILLCNGIPQSYHNILCYGAVVYKV